MDRREVERELADLEPHLRFSVETSGDEVVVRVFDPSTGGVVREVPARPLLAFRRRIDRILGALATGDRPPAREAGRRR
jgi:uncharacterized FlaG/YvyC family protein